jgi:hypothetical protein
VYASEAHTQTAEQQSHVWRAVRWMDDVKHISIDFKKGMGWAI